MPFRLTLVILKFLFCFSDREGCTYIRAVRALLIGYDLAKHAALSPGLQLKVISHLS